MYRGANYLPKANDPHCAEVDRRGAAADVFAASGVDAMLARGGWRSVASARPYVSGDEVAAGLLAQGVVDDSGPEN